MVILQPRDTEENIITGAISSIVSIQNIGATTSGWTAITTDTDIQEFILQARTDTDWRMSLIAGGAYITMQYGALFSSRLVTHSGTVLCYVQPVDGNTVFELVCGR